MVMCGLLRVVAPAKERVKKYPLSTRLAGGEGWGEGGSPGKGLVILEFIGG